MSSAVAPTSVATSADRHDNTAAENSDGATAKQRKRARRVSFAELTSVHIFDRDEEYETPPDKVESETERSEINLVFDQLLYDSKEDSDKGNDDDGDDDEGEDDEIAASFLRPMESSSPGSNFGSATSNDENNFFGPVCPDFIRPGRLSDSSAMSDEHHDITMDSTAFSMHFRSLARSESGIDLKTPTGEHISAEEKTPTQTNNLGSSMSLTMNKTPIHRPSSPLANFIDVGDSNAMSLIGQSMQRYDYEGLSPDIEALFAEGQERLCVASVSGNASVSMSSTNNKEEISSGITDLAGNAKQEDNALVSLNVPSGSVSMSPTNKKMEISSGITDFAGNAEQEANEIVSLNVPPGSVSVSPTNKQKKVRSGIMDLAGNAKQEANVLASLNVPRGSVSISPTNKNMEIRIGITDLAGDAEQEASEIVSLDEAPDCVLVSPTKKKKESRCGITDLAGNAEQEANTLVNLNVPPELSCRKIDDVNVGYKFLSHAIDDGSLLRSTGSASDDADRVNGLPKQLSKEVGESNQSVRDAFEVENSETVCSKDSILGELRRSSCGRESPLVDLGSSSWVKQRLLLLGSPSPVKQNSMAVSSMKDPISLLSNAKRGPSESSASLQKSISELKRVKASLLSSSPGHRIRHMNIRSLQFPETPPLDSVLKKTNKEMGVKCLDASLTSTEEQISGVSQKGGEESNAFALDARNEALSSSRDVIQCEQTLGPQKQGIFLNQFHAGILPTNQLLTPADSLASLTLKKNNIFTSNDLRPKISQTSITDSPLVDYLRQDKPVAHKLVFSPEKSLQSKLSTCSEHLSSPFTELKLHDRHVKNFGPVKSASPIVNVTDGHSLTTATSNLYSFSTLTEEQPGLPVVQGGKVSRQPDRTNSVEAKLLDHKNALRSTEYSRISRNGSSQPSSVILDGNIQGETCLPRLEIDPPELSKSSFGGAASSSVQRIEELAVEKTPAQLSSQSPSAHGFHSLARSNSEYFSIDEATQSPLFSQSSGRPISSSSTKRSSEESTLGDVGHTDEIIMFQRSPKLQKRVGISPGISGYPDDRGKDILEGHLEFRQWKDIKSKLLGHADEWVPFPKEKLPMLTIEKMEDVITRMQRAKAYILHSETLTQKISASLQEKRVVDARRLLSQFVHEKAKLYLRHMKQEKLLERCQLLDSGIQKAQMLKMSCSLHQSIVSRGTQGGAVSSESSSTSGNALQEPHNEVATIKEALEALERKLANLTRTFHSSLKLEGEPNCANTIVAVNEHLKRRMYFRSLRQDMQMCVIQNLSSRNSHYDVILNYLGLLVQSLKLNVGPDLSIVICNNLNDLVISKNYPNINAYAALRFVLKAEISRKFAGRTLVQEMQVTRSLLGNVLDVLAEVQRAQLEFRNLPDVTFSTPTVEKLELQLQFMNFNIPKKVKLTLDISCLNRGVYPSEVVPSQFADPIHSADPLLGAIRDAVKSLRGGYQRILRLCDCISQAVQAWTG